MPDKLIVPDSVTNIFAISEDIGVIVVGNMNDARFVVQYLRSVSAEFKFKFQYEIPVKVLATRMGQYFQKYAQYAGIRPFCAMTTIVGCDEEFGPQCFRIDPSGQSIGFRAVSTGTKEQEAMSQLEKQFKKTNGDWDSKQTLETAVTVLQAVTSSDFKASDIEIGYSTIEKPKFKKLTEAEIETLLNEMADKN